MIEGPAGIGKTALLAAVRGTAADEGMLVLRSRGTELERDFAFGVVRQLFESPLANASELERAELLQSSAGVAASILGLAGEPAAEAPQATAGDPSFAILHGLYWLCANLAAASPLCIVVDDAHWADAPSLRYLAFLLPRLEELDVALVLATRPCDAGTDPELLASVVTDPNAELVRLQPLTRGGNRRARRVRFSRANRIRFSSMPACARRAGRRFCCVCSWTRCEKEASLRPRRPHATSSGSEPGASGDRFA